MAPALQEILDRSDSRLAPDSAIPAIHELSQQLRAMRLELDEGDWRGALREARAAYSGPLEIAEPLKTYEV